MKALSLWEPYASLISLGLKGFETRSWSTHYRGPLLICASKRRLTNQQCLQFLPQIREAIASHEFAKFRYTRLPFGMALCIVDLVEIYRTESLGVIDQACPVTPDTREYALGNYAPGRFAWELKNVRRFKEPWPVTGRQGLFNVPDEEIARHELEVA